MSRKRDDNPEDVLQSQMGDAAFRKWYNTLPPVLDDDGRPNRLRFAKMHEKVTELMFAGVFSGEKIPFNYESAVKGIDSMFRMLGGDPKVLHDLRTDSEKAVDLVRTITEIPSAVFEATEEQIGAVERAMDQADVEVRRYLEESAEGHRRRVMEGPKAAPLPRMTAILGRVKRLQKRARNPFESRSLPEIEKHVFKAAHPLRFMVYVGRSQMTVGESTGEVFTIERVHAKMAWDYYEARGRLKVVSDSSGTPVILPGPRYQFCILVVPPGHGKSEFVTHVAALRICMDANVQMAMLHAVKERAQANMQYVAQCFDVKTANGRRCRALFEVELEGKVTAQRMKVKTDQAFREPTMQASGFMAARLGTGLTDVFCDDIVPISDRDEETTRNRRWDRWSGQWMSRMRGKDSFALLIGTLWHEQDVLMKTIDLARASSVQCLVSMQACGGPDGKPLPFSPLFRLAADSPKLREMYASNPGLYVASYMSDPRSKLTRRILTLRYYDQHSPEHRRFIAGAVKHFSIDPSISGNHKSDKAGLVYAAQGDDVSIDAKGDVEVHQHRQILRILAAWEVQAAPVRASEFITDFVVQNQVDYIHCENHSSANATADILTNHWGLSLIEHKVGPVKKEKRLSWCAGMLDDTMTSKGNPPPVVEFPGFSDGHGRIQPDPAYKWLFDQILLFGVVGGDHCVDAITQLCLHVKPELAPGSAPHEMRREIGQRKTVNQQKLDMIHELMGRKDREKLDPEERICHWN